MPSGPGTTGSAATGSPPDSGPLKKIDTARSGIVSVSLPTCCAMGFDVRCLGSKTARTRSISGWIRPIRNACRGRVLRNALPNQGAEICGLNQEAQVALSEIAEVRGDVGKVRLGNPDPFRQGCRVLIR